jgi:hypothetical protein
MRVPVIVCLLGLSACSMGYWPEVSTGMDGTQYQADVRDCQTASQDAEDHLVFLAGGPLGFNADMALGQRADSKTAINGCMTKRGYIVKASN